MSISQGETRGKRVREHQIPRNRKKVLRGEGGTEDQAKNIIERKFSFFLILLQMVPAVPVKHLLINCSLIMERDNKQRKE